jgi:hypothetical protein
MDGERNGMTRRNTCLGVFRGVKNVGIERFSGTCHPSCQLLVWVCGGDGIAMAGEVCIGSEIRVCWGASQVKLWNRVEARLGKAASVCMCAYVWQGLRDGESTSTSWEILRTRVAGGDAALGSGDGSASNAQCAMCNARHRVLSGNP